MASLCFCYPPPHLRVIIVGFIECNNGRTCNSHPDGCGNKLVLERPDNGVGMVLRVRMTAPEELACFVMGDDGEDGCRVAFLAKEYAAGERGLGLNGAIVRIVDVYLPDNENRSARRLYHHNRGYGIGEIVPKHNNT
jgi:hypothetical protein